MAWAVVTEPMIFEDAQEYAREYDLACVSCIHYGNRLSEFNVRPVVSRYVTNYAVYNYFEDGSYWKSSAADSVKSYAVYYYVPSKVRYNDLLSYIYKHLYPYRGKFNSIILWQTSEADRFIYSCMMGVFHSPMFAPFSNPLFYFETATVPTSAWERKLVNELKTSEKD